jgi:hypothetical protein
MNEQAPSARINVRTYTHNNVNQRWAGLKENKRASQRRRAAATTTLPSYQNLSMQVESLPIDNLFNETRPLESNSASVQQSGDTIEPETILTDPPKKEEHYGKKVKGKGKKKNSK